MRSSVARGSAYTNAYRPSVRPAAAPPSFVLTDEQDAALGAFTQGEGMVLEALAGTGKTSTLKVLANSTTRSGLYLVYNKAGAVEAEGAFPSTTACSTVHSLAYRSTVTPKIRLRLNTPRQTSGDIAKILGIRSSLQIGPKRVLAAAQLARLAIETVSMFAHSADRAILGKHVPEQVGVTPGQEQANLEAAVLPFARAAWKDLLSKTGSLKFDHDHYVKLWQLSEPVLKTDYVLVDECQDSNPVVVDVINRQRDVQVVAVGDSRQQLYGWRGSVDALDAFGASSRLYLTQSFRFGPSIAAEANKWLAIMGDDIEVRGTPSIKSRVAPLEAPSAVLCRTNAGVIQHVMAGQRGGQKVAIVGGGQDVKRLAGAAKQLKDSGKTWHPDLCMFTSWSSVQDYVEEDFGGQDLKTLVNLVDTYGAGSIIRAVDAAVPEQSAAIVVSTVHKAKGREWPKVLIADDFSEPRTDEFGVREDVASEDAMTAYVAVTRAQHVLDVGGLSWVDAHLAATK